MTRDLPGDDLVFMVSHFGDHDFPWASSLSFGGFFVALSSSRDYRQDVVFTDCLYRKGRSVRLSIATNHGELESRCPVLVHGWR